jgi:hypothetical protein
MIGPLLFRCPRTADYIRAQVETDDASILSSRNLAMRVYCPHCRTTHDLPLRQAVIELPGAA